MDEISEAKLEKNQKEHEGIRRANHFTETITAGS
jgi:hypothetical protein